MGLGYPDTYSRLAAIPSAEPIPSPGDLWPLLLEAIGESFGPFLPPFPDALATIEALGEKQVPQAVASRSLSTATRGIPSLRTSRRRSTGQRRLTTWLRPPTTGPATPTAQR